MRPSCGSARRGSAFIGGPASVYAISSDGRLHRLNTSTGDDMTQPVSVLPANARATSLNMVDNVIYTMTTHECNDAPNAVWAIDLNVDPPKVRSFALSGGTSWSIGGPVIGGTGAVHIQTSARVDSTEQWTAGVHSFTPGELKAKFTPPQTEAVPQTPSISAISLTSRRPFCLLTRTES